MMRERTAMLIAILAAGAGWGALAYLMLTQHPTQLALIAFFPLLALAVAGTFAPLVRVLHRRFISPRRWPEPIVALRQSLWIGLFAALGAAMQLARQLDWASLVVLGAIFVLLEGILHRRA